MKSALLAAAATVAFASAANAADYYYYQGQGQPRTQVYVAPYAPGLNADEVRDYQIKMLERRQQMERDALEFRQKAERRALDDD